uniref:uncharacterized protein LOC104266141 isoform X3 n=1 Tax=Ciona intestinalis TaxID=7719 RepID=UPI00089DCA33|nr:uncharacterized protein LOC104266141 isoform X3 [Ciona intestinalis]|eukprot:XP_009860001.2 uncharacterized protein LOC104266141 isoform X3 [Ciona intestinalis]
MMNSMIETCIIMIREKEQIEQAQNAADPSEESNGVNSKSHAAATSVQTSSTLVRPLFARQNTVTKNRPEKLSFTRLSDSDSTTVDTPSPTTPTAGKAKKRFLKTLSRHKDIEVLKEERNELL